MWINFLEGGAEGGGKRWDELAFAQDHCPGEVLNRFFDHIGEDEHHGSGLILGEAFILEPSNKL